jgi:hypothetical protein
MRERSSRPPTVTRADLLEQVEAIVRRTLKRPDFRLPPYRLLTTEQVLALLETLQCLEARACRHDGGG